MKAIVQRVYGPPSVLSLSHVEAPRLAEREVLVRVHASPVTQADCRLRAGDFPSVSWLPGRLLLGLTGPRSPIPGSAFAGRVEAVGAGVTRFAVGDDVFGNALSGAYAELLAMPEDGRIAKMPAGLGYDEAAAVPYGALTALVFLRDLGGVKAGQRVCVLGASGGVGLFAVQVAKHLGAEVTAVCSARSHALVRSLGADAVVDRAADFRASGRYDVIFDPVDATSFERCRGSLTPDGRYLNLMLSVRLLWQRLWTSFVGRQRVIGGVAMGTWRDFDELAALLERGALRPVIDRTFPLDRIADAHARLESGEALGTVVVSVAEAPRASSAVAG